jgi:hypothetical protein
MSGVNVFRVEQQHRHLARPLYPGPKCHSARPMYTDQRREAEGQSAKIIQRSTAPCAWPPCRLEYRFQVSVEPSQSTHTRCFSYNNEVEALWGGCVRVLTATATPASLRCSLGADKCLLLGPFEAKPRCAKLRLCQSGPLLALA